MAWFRSAMRLDAGEWDVAERVAIGLFVAPIIGAGMVAATALYRPLYRLFVNEDALLEWAQVGVLLALVALGAMIGLRLARLGHRWFATLFVIAALAALFIAGEEISWGQRLLGWATPEDLADINSQGETNLHNIGSALRFMNLIMFIIATVAGVLPFVWRWGAGLRPRSLTQVLLVPPVFLASWFLAAASYRLFRYALVPETGYVISRFGEVCELLLYAAFAAFAWLIYRRLGKASA